MRWIRVEGIRGGITVASAAEESVCPEEWGKDMFGTLGFGESGRMDFRAANGSRIGHFGRRRATFRGKGKKGMLGMEFQVAEVKKPLAAVWRICEKGNRVCFGPGEQDNFVENLKNGEKMFMKRVGGSYVLEVDFVEDRTGVFQGRA